MQYNTFGQTDLLVSAIGFGAWAIGGPAMAGDMPIGWSDVSDEQSVAALHKALDLGITFFDTADFYGLGHSEILIGEVIGNRSDVVIATKVGHRLGHHGKIYFDYSDAWIRNACEQSLLRLRRDCIDFYQLHTARMPHLEEGVCISAMQRLQEEGKIRYWGLSLNTFEPEPEANYLMEHNWGQGFQLVFNIINQRSLKTMEKAQALGYGVIARMPLQFGLLAGKFTRDTRFPADDHRSFRLPPPLLTQALDALAPVWEMAEKYSVSPASLALSFILSHPAVSTVIPGIKTPNQVIDNTIGLTTLREEDRTFLHQLFTTHFDALVAKMV